MRRILLVMPSSTPGRSVPDIRTDTIDCAYVPLSVLSIAAFLEQKGYSVTFVDARLHSAEEARSVVAAALPGVSVVGFSVMTASVREALDLSDLVKDFDRRITVIWGGVHPSLFPEQTADDSNVDFAVAGEGEIPLGRLMDHLDGGDAGHPNIPNVGCTDNGQVHFTREFTFTDVNRLPLPAYHLVDVERYCLKPHFDGKRKRSLEIQTSRGCPSRCAFCVNTIVSRRRWRAQNPDVVADHVSRIIHRYNLDHILFLDESFFPNIRRARKIIEFMKTLPVTWEADCRANYFREKSLDDATLQAMHESGCTMLRIGLESGSERMRQILKKDISENDILRAVEKCVRFGIQPMVSYMIGMPHETREDIIQTIRLVERLQRIAPNMIHSGPQVFRPYPGGELYDECLRAGYREPRTLREWHAANPSDFSAHRSYPWMEDQAFTLDMVTAMSLVDTENTRAWPMSPDYRKQWGSLTLRLRKWGEGAANLRYRRGCWRFMVDMRLARTYMERHSSR